MASWTDIPGYFMDLVGSPFGQTALNWYGGTRLQEEWDEAKEANEARYQDILQKYGELTDKTERELRRIANEEGLPYDQLYNRVMKRAVQLKAEVTGGYNQLIGDFGKTMGDIMGRYDTRTTRGLGYLDRLGEELKRGYAERLETGMGYLEGAGTQQKADIDEAYRRFLAEERQGLAARGFGRGTIGMALSQNVEADRLAEQRRLSEDLNRQYMDAYSLLSGEGLAARERFGALRSDVYGQLTGESLSAYERLAGAKTALGQDKLAAVERLGGAISGYDVGLTQAKAAQQQAANDRYLQYMTNLPLEKLRFMERREDVYPQSNMWLNLAQQSAAATYEPPEQQTDWLTPTLGLAGSIAGGPIGGAIGSALGKWWSGDQQSAAAPQQSSYSRAYTPYYYRPRGYTYDYGGSAYY